MSGRPGNNSGKLLLDRIPAGISAKTFFRHFLLGKSDEAALRIAAREDARKYVYNAVASLLGGIADIHAQRAAWAATKFYYTAFYIGRAALCRSGLVIFHAPKENNSGFTQFEIRALTGSMANISDTPSTHKLVAVRFKESGYPPFMKNLQIDGVDPILWLMDQREHWQYRAGRFPDPEMPDVFSRIDPKEIQHLLSEYAADTSGVYLADQSHALISIPFRLVEWGLSKDSLISPGVVDVEDIAYLRRRCRITGQKLTAVDRCVLNSST